MYKVIQRELMYFYIVFVVTFLCLVWSCYTVENISLEISSFANENYSKHDDYTTKKTTTTERTSTKKIEVTSAKEIVMKYPLKCYGHYNSSTLDDISDVNPKKGKSIFFIESSCRSNEVGKIVLNSRQACAIESAALMNPDFEIYLLMMSPGVIKNTNDLNDRTIAMLTSYENVKIKHVNYDRYFHGTPVYDLYKSDKLKKSSWVVSHMSDVLRYLTLWKYGGIYMDLDVLITSNFANIPPNFSGRQDMSSVAAGVMGFEPDGKGHKWAQMCLDDLNKNFQPHIWVHNGPGVIERLLSKICNGTKLTKMNAEKCDGFEVYDPEDLYPVRYYQWRKLFEKQYLKETLALVAKSKAFHIWNQLSKDTKIKINKFESALEILASIFCPKLYNLLDKEL